MLAHPVGRDFGAAGTIGEQSRAAGRPGVTASAAQTAPSCTAQRCGEEMLRFRGQSGASKDARPHFKVYKSTMKIATPPRRWEYVQVLFTFCFTHLRLSEAARHKLTHVRAASMPAEMEVRFVQLPATGALFYT